MIEQIKNEFQKRYGEGAELYASPGRINLIGEHTDYNEGFVLPGAIDKAIYVAIKPNGTDKCNLYSVDYNEEVSFDVNGSQPEQQWASYVYGVIQEMKKRGAEVKGFDCAFGGNVPLGAGLSSSAALESSVGFAINDIFKLGFDRKELALIGQATEHNYVGVKCGIMDQFISLFGEAGKVLKLDCRDLSHELVPFDPKGYKLVLIDSMVKHSLASSEYNVRREQCEKGVAAIQKQETGINSLRDVSMEMLNKYKNEMEPIVYQRCSYVVKEDQRLLDGCEALKAGDYNYFGKKMYETHDGLSKDYGVSCDELDFIVGVAREHEGVVGARMMGGGFGGCVINLVKDDAYDKYLKDVKVKFEERFGVEPRVIEVVISDGARKLS